MGSKISLLVPTLGLRELELKRLFNTLAKQDYKNIEVIVISQNNHQIVSDLCDIYKKSFFVKHIVTDKKGLSLARNMGIKYATGEIIVLLDDDCWYPNDAMKFIAKEFETHPEVDVLLTQIYDPIADCPYKKYDDVPMRLNKATSLLSRSSIELSYRKGEDPILFDERFGLGARYVAGEENDFLYRCLKLKKEIIYRPKVTVFHEKKVYKETNAQLIAKGAFYSKNFGFITSNVVLLRDLIKKHQNNYRWFWNGYFEFRKIARKNKRKN